MTESGDAATPDPAAGWFDGGDPSADEAAEAGGPHRPWYRRPAPLAGAVLAAVALLLGGMLLLRSDEAAPVNAVSTLRFQRTDSVGNPLARRLVAEVTGDVGAAGGFVWLVPLDARAPGPASATTDSSSGGAEFRWQPAADVADRGDWSSSVVVIEELASDESLADREFDCTFVLDDGLQGSVPLRVSYDDGGDLRSPRTAIYRFVGYRFVGGEVMTCVIPGATSLSGTTASSDGSAVPAPTTTTPLGTETPSDTTGAPGTTQPDAPQPATTQPAGTQPGSTQPGSTQPGTTQLAAGSVMTVIDGRADLSVLRDLIDFAGLRDTFADPAISVTFFAPTNEALTDLDLVPERLDDGDRQFVTDVLLTHLHRGGALSRAQVLALTELDVAFGGPQLIDGGEVPPTIGFVDIIEFDVTAANGVVHVVNDVLFAE